MEKAHLQTATLAGGCFWGVEALIEAIPGVIDTQVGYTGGITENPTYPTVKLGRTGHAEAIQITFDPAKLNYRDLLLHFFRLHDPTSFNRQGNDLGSQYRSAIFFHNEEQKAVALEVIQYVNKTGVWPKPLVTEVIAYQKFFDAEEYHQDYLQKNPGGYTCHYYRDFKL